MHTVILYSSLWINFSLVAGDLHFTKTLTVNVRGKSVSKKLELDTRKGVWTTLFRVSHTHTHTCKHTQTHESVCVLTIETTGGGGFPFLSAPVCWFAAGFRLSLDCCMGSGWWSVCCVCCCGCCWCCCSPPIPACGLPKPAGALSGVLTCRAIFR